MQRRIPYKAKATVQINMSYTRRWMFAYKWQMRRLSAPAGYLAVDHPRMVSWRQNMWRYKLDKHKLKGQFVLCIDHLWRLRRRAPQRCAHKALKVAGTRRNKASGRSSRLKAVSRVFFLFEHYE